MERKRTAMGETYIVELHNVWMPDFLENRDLPIDPFQVCVVLDLLFLEDFDSDLATIPVRNQQQDRLEEDSGEIANYWKQTGVLVGGVT